MKKYILLIVVLYLLPAVVRAQTYKYIGVEDGLSNRQVYAIEKDRKGYMWFLTPEGLDRYNGKDFKHYKLMDGEEELNSAINLNWLYLDTEGVLWEIGKKGRVFRYDAQHDRFRLAYKLPQQADKEHNTPVSYGYVDNRGQIWLCTRHLIYLYNSHNGQVTYIRNRVDENITSILQTDDTHYFIGTDHGVHYATLKDGILQLEPCDKLDALNLQVNELYLDKATRKVFIGTFLKGIFVYDLNRHRLDQLQTELTDITINCIRDFGRNTLLIATDGAGVYRLNTDTYECEPYITADYNRYNAMNGNSITDLYIDDERRIWMANFPIGITVRDNRYTDFQWIKHSIGNRQSLVNNRVNAIIEDRDGDLWFATDNGISLYNDRQEQWTSFLSMFDPANPNKSHSYISLCEVEPGIIWAGGYSSGIYQIDKRSRTVQFFTPGSMGNASIRADKYIRAILKTGDGKIWAGGYYNLKEIDYRQRQVRLVEGFSDITALAENDSAHLWVGTVNGLYRLEKKSGKAEYIELPVESHYVYALYQSADRRLYIGTNNTGLLVYDLDEKQFFHFNKDNSSLLSNNVYCILPDGEGGIFLSTENALTTFAPHSKTFHNWTKEQGLKAEHFNPSAGTLRRNGQLIFGSTDGAIEFDKNMVLPDHYTTKMVFSDFKVLYETVYPGDKHSPLTTDIDDTHLLRLKYNQNIFSLQVSSINYDYPSLVLYSWKLEGFYDKWSQPGRNNIISFTNLSPGEYVLRVRAISNENHDTVLEERSLPIVIAQPVWFSWWAWLVYVLFTLGALTTALRIYLLRKQKRESNEKIRFFINTAHDIRTPLTLIKAPLEDLANHEHLSESGRNNINTALRNVHVLLRLTTNLINFERADTYGGKLRVAEYELGAYLEETVNIFREYAKVRRISLTYEKNFEYLNVWMDKDKMDSILKNILSNALKYTPDGGRVTVVATETAEQWSVEVRDTGIGVPADEQKKLFKMHFRGSNAVNSKIAGSGIGLLLVRKLVRLHKGRLNFSSAEGKGSVVKIAFPRNKKHYQKAFTAITGGMPADSTPDTALRQQPADGAQAPHRAAPAVTPTSLPKILVVEDNDELRNYLKNTLAAEYTIQACNNGKQALEVVRDYAPDLIISDIMMPEMRGDELCRILKQDINTSHIPIVLLTALNNEQSIIEGLQTGADEYIVKPFNVGILRATIANLLQNRRLLLNKYTKLALNDEKPETESGCNNCTDDLDWKFIASVTRYVEDNLEKSDFNVDSLCALMNMSRTSFYNKLKALTDQAPADYIRIIRLKRAAKLLREKQHNITEIAELTGFNDVKYFREVFKKYYKVSPSQYAKGEGEPADQAKK